MSKARIYRSSKREFLCKLLDSGEMVTATALGNLLKKGGDLVVGDYVLLEQQGEEYVITSLEERKNEIFRLLIRERKKKVTASNCDLLVILNSVSKPNYKQGIVDRYLVRAHQWGIEPVVVFNKMDQFDPESFDIKFEELRLADLGVKCFEITALNPEYEPQYLERGFTQLKQYIEGTTSIFLGQSGVGKSKTITALSEGETHLLSKDVGKSGKGSHTTTWAEIVDCHGFELIDSPGIRSFALEDIDPEELVTYFPDIETIATQCKFRDCKHTEKSKQCAFWQMDPDDRRTQAIHSRLESFQRIHEEVSEIPHWKKSY